MSLCCSWYQSHPVPRLISGCGLATALHGVWPACFSSVAVYAAVPLSNCRISSCTCCSVADQYQQATNIKIPAKNLHAKILQLDNTVSPTVLPTGPPTTRCRAVLHGHGEELAARPCIYAAIDRRFHMDSAACWSLGTRSAVGLLSRGGSVLHDHIPSSHRYVSKP